MGPYRSNTKHPNLCF